MVVVLFAFCWLVQWGGGARQQQYWHLTPLIDESRKEAAKGVARFPNRCSSRDGHPCYISPPGVRFSLFSLVSCFLLFASFLFVSFLLPAVLGPVFSSSYPSRYFIHAADICPPSSAYAFLLLIAAFLISLRHFVSCFMSSFIFAFIVCFFFFFVFFRSRLCCCALVPGTLAFHLLDPWVCDYFFGLFFLCLTVCDHKISISLG